MALVEISSYEIGWNPKTKRGAVRIKLVDGQEYPIQVNSAEELTALGMVLNESPVVLNTDTGYIMTPDWEPVGGT
jgi:hypothetical protein